MARYSKAAEKKIHKVMKEYKEGDLHSGTGGKKVKSRKQAVAIAISAARQSGAKVPPAQQRRSHSGGGRSGGSRTGRSRSS